MEQMGTEAKGRAKEAKGRAKTGTTKPKKKQIKNKFKPFSESDLACIPYLH